ncbi:MAG: polyhydroxyalkanoic acid system family protein [Gammaproteobacteria bacterium]
MSVIRVCRKHSLGYDRACETAEEFVEKLQAEFNADYHWDEDDLRFSAKGLKGNIHIEDDSVEIRVDIGLMYRPFKAKIEKTIASELDDILKA